MSKEVIIIAIAWILTVIMLLVFVPRNKFREAQVIFFFKLLITLLFGLLVAQYELIEYPVRSLSNATKVSFDFEYFIYPSICVVFNLHYPEMKNKFGQFMYYVYFCTVMTIIEILCEKYTDVINYIHWNWFLTWITLFITFYISRKYYLWFFRLKS